MKLHLGCGKRYFDGYVNIDAFDTSVADKIMSIDKLNFPDNSVDLVETYHAIEHLDRSELNRALDEWYRVLKLDGLLIIECPDFEDAIINFLKSSYDKRWQKAIIPIYGQQGPGQEHKYGFTFERLRDLLEQKNFWRVWERRPTTCYLRPSLRVEAIKKRNLTGALPLFENLFKKDVLHQKIFAKYVSDLSEQEFDWIKDPVKREEIKNRFVREIKIKRELLDKVNGLEGELAQNKFFNSNLLILFGKLVMHEWLDPSAALKELVKGTSEWPKPLRPEIVKYFIELLVKEQIVLPDEIKECLDVLKQEIVFNQRMRDF